MTAKWSLRLAGIVGALVLVGCPDDNTGGKGVPLPPVPDVLVGDGGGDVPPAGTCTLNDDCAAMAGVDTCTQGLCDFLTGECFLWEKPNCCTGPESCDDGDPATIDGCHPELAVCTHEDPSQPCEQDSECVSTGQCTSTRCQGNCVSWQTPGCCESPADCDDGDGCTVDSCEERVCQHSASSEPACCSVVLYQNDFSGSLGDAVVEDNGQPARWHYSTTSSHSADGAARFADPETGIYGNPETADGTAASQGKLVLPAVEVPAGKTVELTFWIRVDVEKAPQFDLVSLVARVGGETASLWSKSQLSDSDFDAWTKVTVDLSPFAGKAVVLAFGVDTLDGTKNDGAGVWVDDIRVAAACDEPLVCEPGTPCPEDGNPCTESICRDDGTCGHKAIEGCCLLASDCAQVGAACMGVTCKDHQCVVEREPGCCSDDSQCVDNDPCSVDRCVGGQCQHAAGPNCCKEDAQCEDGDPCTFDRCADGQCEHMPTPDCCDAALCDDGNPCTEDACVFGQCIWQPIPGCGDCTVLCDDGDPCTVDECSADGQCFHEPLPECCVDGTLCDDKNPCTEDLCLPGVGICTHLPKPGCCANDAQCPAPGPCTKTWCENGVCMGVQAPGCCVTNAECKDSDPCSADLCIGSQCTHPPIIGCCVTAQDCNDNDPCTVEQCTSTGTCVYKTDPNCGGCTSNAQCADNNPCTADLCFGGQCLHSPILGCCTSGVQCNDGDPCTQDACQNGQCTHIQIPGCGPVCTTDVDCKAQKPCVKGVCQAGQCQFLPVPGCCMADSDCFGPDPCVQAMCVQNQCVVFDVPNCCADGQVCDDGNPCTIDQCLNGTCTSVPSPFCQCQTDSQCPTAPCQTAHCLQFQCVYETDPSCCASDAQCEDGNPCTVNACAADGTCVSKPVPGCCTSSTQCADDSPCTKDACVQNKCTHTPVPGCCTGPLACNDNNACTADTCDAATLTCHHAGIAGCCTSAAQCADGNPCTADACVQNTCKSTPTPTVPGCCAQASDCEDGNPCTTHVCDQGVCGTKAVPDCCQTAADCEDGVVCTKNECINGSCQTSSIPGCCANDAACDDGVSCTTEYCHTGAKRCIYTVPEGCCVLDSDCADTDACTQDTCEGETCVHQAIPFCCTQDADCTDGAACQSGKCLAGQCFYDGVAGCCTDDAACNDGNACTKDTCAASQCTHTAIAGCCTQDAQCEDGDPCTKNTCSANKCTSVADPTCCAPKPLYKEGFAQAEVPAGWSSQVLGQSYWHVSKLQAHGAPYSLRFGNPETGSYQNGDAQSAGSVSTPTFQVPANTPVLLTFWLDADIEQEQGFDLLELRVGNGTSAQVVWNKTALSADQYGTWVPIQINLTPFGGQNVRLTWRFDSVDGLFNDGQGVFIDDVLVETSCKPISICVFDTDCSDGQACTEDTCVNGACAHAPIPDCCTNAAQCDDGYVCTADICDNGTCSHQQKPGCCQFNAECQDTNPCTNTACVQNQCQTTPASGPGCCTADDACASPDPACVKAYCADFQCQYEADTGANCCKAASLFSAAFDDGTSGGFTLIDDGGPAFWSVQQKRHASEPFSLYYGIPGAWTYIVEGGTTGMAISPSIAIPLTAAKATLTFQTWMNVTPGEFTDTYTVSVLSGQTLKPVWSKAQAPQGSFTKWTLITVDLTAYRGKTVQLYWTFAGGDSPFGGAPGEGIYVDDINLKTSCN